ncbi:2480360d-9ae0-4acd-ae1b-4ec17b5e0e4c [Thermothielavioides terrestris]|uniref:2480360d-9ae0-4acd-ae1b-4ec17b5e0e4c n=1 Tax=Thermothielavioides terrestris TaxID=2587410 RepID=A0A446BFV3_9PEZI|nr:2480360d-9ae0-4acd-ae1b-4ec17b5e0e4c [Thermothielavioides terrestris]
MALGSFVLSLIATAATFQVGSLLSSLLVTSSGSVINRPNVFPQAVHARNITPIGPQQLRWDGPVWRDKPDQTLWVNDIDDLWNQVLALNPQWVEMLPDPSETMKDYGTRHCGAESNLATGDSSKISELLTKLGSLRGSWSIKEEWCYRLGCSDNAGIYWCNTNKWAIRAEGLRLYTHGVHVRDLCCHRSDGSLYAGDPISGWEMFPDSDNEAAHSYVAIGYGSCSDPRSAPPSFPLIHGYPGSYGNCRA